MCLSLSARWSRAAAPAAFLEGGRMAVFRMTWDKERGCLPEQEKNATNRQIPATEGNREANNTPACDLSVQGNSAIFVQLNTGTWAAGRSRYNMSTEEKIKATTLCVIYSSQPKLTPCLSACRSSSFHCFHCVYLKRKQKNQLRGVR